MKHIFNQKGYTLIMVLLTIVIISIFSMTLIPKSINTALQVNKTEANVQVKELAEMGVYYSIPFLQQVILKSIEHAKTLNTSVPQNERFCTGLRNQLSKNPDGKLPEVIVTQDFNNFQLSYKVTFYDRNSNPLSSSNCINFDYADVKVISSGSVDRQVTAQRTVEVLFSIRNRSTQEDCPVTDPMCEEDVGGDGESRPLDPNLMDLIVIKQDMYYSISGSTSQTIYSSAHFTRLVTLAGSQGARLNIAGNAWFDDTVRFNGNNSKLYIVGNAYFRNKVDFRGQGNNYVCVGGTAYLYNSTKRAYEDYHELNTLSYCPPLIYEEFRYFLEAWDLFGFIDGELIITY